MHLFKWKARRAGARITVVGEDAAGKDQKITGIDKIEPAPGRGMCFAIDKDGERHTLAV